MELYRIMISHFPNLFQKNPQIISQKQVLKLGSGIGIIGIIWEVFGPSRVLLTDLIELVPLISLNMQLKLKNHDKSELIELIEWYE